MNTKCQSNFVDVKRLWNIDEKAYAENRYEANFVEVHKNGRDFTFESMQEGGLMNPLLFQGTNSLGLRVPSESFLVNDVKTCVGANRIIKVMDVDSQRVTEMKMRDWCAYFNNPLRERILCVTSLEFSSTKLEHYVESPTVIRQSDWYERAWPVYLKQSHLNDEDKITFPKVRKYVHMAAGGSYIEWTFGIGGSSVWYHVLRGTIICWIVAPTEENLMRFEKWLQTPQLRSETFFGDIVTRGSHQCQRIQVQPSNTLFLPSGWLYALYMPDDCLAFGGHFLHSFSGSMQISAWHLEEKIQSITCAPRYPFYLELNWYVMARYVCCLLGRDHVAPLPGAIDPMDKLHRFHSGDLFHNYDVSSKSFFRHQHKGDDLSAEAADAALDDHMSLIAAKNEGLIVDRENDPRWQNMTRLEWDTLVEVVDLLKTEYLKNEFSARPPGDIGENAPKLLKDFRLMMRLHADDPVELSITGTPLLRWPPGLEASNHQRYAGGGGGGSGSNSGGIRRASGSANLSKSGGSQAVDNSGGAKRRRIRCRNCEPCRRDNCRDCLFCADMAKYGGTGTMKQCCIQKQCIAPVLPSSTYCEFCLETSHATEEEKEADDYDMDRDIYECGICWQFAHPRCLREHMISKGIYQDNVQGVVLSDLPNYWECPMCIVEGKHGSAKSRIPKGLQVLRKMEQDEADGEINGSKGGGHHPHSTRSSVSGMMPPSSSGEQRTNKSRTSTGGGGGGGGGSGPAAILPRTRPPTTRNAATRRPSTVLLHTGEAVDVGGMGGGGAGATGGGGAGEIPIRNSLSSGVLNTSVTPAIAASVVARSINFTQLQTRENEMRHCVVRVEEMNEQDKIVSLAFQRVLDKGLKLPFWRSTTTTTSSNNSSSSNTDHPDDDKSTMKEEYSSAGEVKKMITFTLPRRGTLSMPRADMDMASMKKYSSEYISELMSAVNSTCGPVNVVVPLGRGRPGRPPATSKMVAEETVEVTHTRPSKSKQARVEKNVDYQIANNKDCDDEDNEETMTIRSRRRGIQKPRRFAEIVDQ